MIELSQHIEVLLLENDCVIVPGLGGFVAHYTPAIQVEENMFLPPTRTIGFNPQLKLNDGLLVQSYMAVYDTNFSDASKIVEDEVSELIIMLHKVRLIWIMLEKSGIRSMTLMSSFLMIIKLLHLIYMDLILSK